MVVSQPDLRAAVEEKRVQFNPPLNEQQWGPASVDLRLGFKFTRLKALDGVTVSVAAGLGVLSSSGFWDTIDLEEPDAFGKRQSFMLEPGEFVLAMTHEAITIPNNMIALVEGRSTYARVGISMHQTAPWIQPGWPGRPIVLEMLNNGPNQVSLTPLIDRPCQLTFFALTSPLTDEMTYGARATDAYAEQAHPLAVKPKQ